MRCSLFLKQMLISEIFRSDRWRIRLMVRATSVLTRIARNASFKLESSSVHVKHVVYWNEEEDKVHENCCLLDCKVFWFNQAVSLKDHPDVVNNETYDEHHILSVN